MWEIVLGWMMQLPPAALAAFGMFFLMVLLTVPVLGWRYGRRRSASWVGLVVRLVAVAVVGSWTLLLVAAHGFGILPLPSLACAAIQNGREALCFPPWWATLVCSIVLYVVPALISAWRARGRFFL